MVDNIPIEIVADAHRAALVGICKVQPLDNLRGFGDAFVVEILNKLQTSW